jgi:tetratricopeptide (TPR) repeat protein
MSTPPSSSLAKDRPLRVFLCHSSGDKQFVRELDRRLTADGFKPWLDEKELVPGQPWQEELSAAVRASDVVVVCLSKGSVGKEGYLQREISDALNVAQEKPEGTIFIIPVRIDAVDVPPRLAKWQWANFFPTDEHGYEDGYQQLVRSLNLRAKAIGLALLRPEAMYDKGRAYYQANNYEQARDWFQQAADAGHAGAMNMLGLLYNNALGVNRDFRRAFDWQERAAKAGDADAMHNLGFTYAEGRGVPKDIAKARDWYQKALAAGNLDARQKLRRLDTFDITHPASTGTTYSFEGLKIAGTEPSSSTQTEERQGRPTEATSEISSQAFDADENNHGSTGRATARDFLDFESFTTAAFWGIFSVAGTAISLSIETFTAMWALPSALAATPAYALRVALLVVILMRVVRSVVAMKTDLKIWQRWVVPAPIERGSSYAAIGSLSILLGLEVAFAYDILFMSMLITLSALVEHWTQWLSHHHFQRAFGEMRHTEGNLTRRKVLEVIEHDWLARPHLVRITMVMFFSATSFAFALRGGAQGGPNGQKWQSAAYIILILDIVANEIVIAMWRRKRDLAIAELCQAERI